MDREIVKPNLFIPGAAKSGTSALHEFLDRHPDICMSRVKEPHFFSHDDRFAQKDWYYGLFENCSDVKIRGESSTGYMVFPGVIERIKKEIGNPYFVFLLRNPIDRIYSHYWWLRGQGYETRPFREAILSDMHDEPDPGKVVIDFYKFYFQYSLYGKWLSRFFDNFPAENILIITTEDFKNNTREVLSKIFGFLGVNDIVVDDSIVANKTVILKYPRLYFYAKKIFMDERSLLRKLGGRIVPSPLKPFVVDSYARFLDLFRKESEASYPPLDPETRKWLRDLLQEDVERLKRLTSLKFESWSDFAQ